MKNKIFSNNYYTFIIIVFISIISTFITNYFLITDNLIYNSLSEQFADEQIRMFIDKSKNWYWTQYTIIPLIILIRAGLVSFCLSVGMFFYNMEHKTPYKRFFQVALSGEFVLILASFIKFGYFYLIKTDYALQDLQQYYPLAYINFLDLEKIQPWLFYPLKTINLFEMTYFFVLVYGMHKLLKSKYSKSFEITALSYGTGLTIWIGLVMFLTLNYT